jgi:hypothetical protein
MKRMLAWETSKKLILVSALAVGLAAALSALCFFRCNPHPNTITHFDSCAIAILPAPPPGGGGPPVRIECTGSCHIEIREEQFCDYSGNPCEKCISNPAGTILVTIKNGCAFGLAGNVATCGCNKSRPSTGIGPTCTQHLCGIPGC